VKTYQVGGAVRDRLSGAPVKDRDWVVVGATAADLLALGFRQVGREFPVFLHPDTGEEYALARTERKTGPGHTGFVFDTSPEITLEDDLARRDLTVNAMAMDEDGAIIDPFRGQADLAEGILRHVSPAFAEDPLRVLRVARFAARFDFRVAPETEQLMRRMADSGALDELTPERVWGELEKALAAPHPVRFFEVLRACGAQAGLFPEIDRLFGVPQPAEHHPEIDTGVHVMLVLAQAARMTDDPVTRFAALTHDLGKGTTPADMLPHHNGHEQRSVSLVNELCDRYRIPNLYRELAALTARYHGHCHDAAELRPGTLLAVLDAFDAFRRPDRIERFLQACEADFRGRPGYEQRPYPQARLFRDALTAARQVDSAELLAAGVAGKALGEALHQRRAEAIRAALTDR
jgi:tRNA nucleotidyltransferase (CCA-adding enzyme)